MSHGPSFPPLMQGINAAGADPFEAACEAASNDCDAGSILYDITPDRLRAAIVLAPEVPLAKAAAMLPLTAVAVQNALGALGPAELPVHLEWSGPIRVNGARCGAVKAAASGADLTQPPAWMVTGFTLTFARPQAEGGATPDETDLMSEGCGGLSPTQFLESWSRHLLNWINRWEDDGMAPLHREFAGLAYGLGEDIEVLGRSGHFLGLDEDLGLLLRSGGQTTVIPVTDLLETRT
ncbi:biotin/lipoate--protein ligase family protein [Marivita hallyeonensis]|uniref:Biotin-(Acetyl-CoA carboxylase) ligase n=1 Tax=Marivita hallyeonensis TaxID=996342 RepID=A0A1M5N9D1_9RHOB|nr:biotin/lipoate--protein ligase family protein [Marivita hallyeonensis]SHG86107.1 Biotin-(acetyl-CoA carboxylase) ligase [Marivita hallyeonensis]